MKKIMLTVLGLAILLGPMEMAQEGSSNVFKLGIQAANAHTLDDTHMHYAKKKSSKKSKSKKSKSSKRKKKDDSSKSD